MPKAGDRISLRTWEGKPYRSKQRVLRDAEITSVVPIYIEEGKIVVDGCRYMPGKADVFARADGFRDAEEMERWFSDAHGLPFMGVLISWTNS